MYSTALADWAIHRVKCQTVLFQIIQFSISTQFRCQKQFYFEQFRSALVRSSNVKTLLFLNNSVLHKDLTPLQRCSQCILQPQLTGHLCVVVSSEFKFFFKEAVPMAKSLESEFALLYLLS